MSDTVSLEFTAQIEADLRVIQDHILAQLGEHALMPWALPNLEFHSHSDTSNTDVKRLYVPGEGQLLETTVVGPNGGHLVDVRTQTEDGGPIQHETSFWKPANSNDAEKTRDPISAVFSVDASGTIIDSLDHRFTNPLSGSARNEVFRNTAGTSQLILMLDKMLGNFVEISNPLEHAIMQIDNPRARHGSKEHAMIQPTQGDVDVDRALREEQRRNDTSLEDAIARSEKQQ